MKNQLNLYVNLSLGRNILIIKFLKKFFPLNYLIESLFDEKINENLRIIYAKLIQHIYIDCYPRKSLLMPNRIKLIKNNNNIEKMESLKGEGFYIQFNINFF